MNNDSKCHGGICPLKMYCERYRSKAGPRPSWSYWAAEEDGGACEGFIQTRAAQVAELVGEWDTRELPNV